MYNKRNIMTRAHELRKAGKGMSDALKHSWVEAKIKAIDERLFFLDMIDFQSSENRAMVRDLNQERSRLNAIINPPVEKVKRKPNPDLDYFEEITIRVRLLDIKASRNPDWNEYKQLENRLYVA